MEHFAVNAVAIMQHVARLDIYLNIKYLDVKVYGMSGQIIQDEVLAKDRRPADRQK